MLLSSLLLSSALAANAHLPPLMPWQGKSEQLMQNEGKLLTEFEKSKGMRSPNYQKTVEYLTALQQANPEQFSLVTIGESDAGRAIYMLVATEAGENSAAQISQSTKPTLLIQAGIHSGEIDGKDAGFMLLRDITQGKKADLLKKANLLFIPILNVDGHERQSQFNRINQRGPEVMGFRTNAKNLNLNRDFTKLDTPAVRALSQVVQNYNPSLYLDIHVTDGADYQYDITFGYSPEFASSTPKITRALDQYITPYLNRTLSEQGHIPGPLVFVMNKQDFAKGLAGWVATPRYSNGWGELRHLPTILVENHSLKPYKQRVLGSYVLIEGAINALDQYQKQLASAVNSSKQARPNTLVVERSYATKPDHIAFKGIDYQQFHSDLTGQTEVRYLGKAKNYDALPIFWQKDVKKQVNVPQAFYIPVHYKNILTLLNQQGISYTRLNKVQQVTVEQAKVTEYEFAKMPFEGRFRVNAEFEYKPKKVELDKSWVKVSTDQPLGLLATHLLHPEAVDSLFQWGFFNTIFQRTEYVENYALIPYSKKQLNENNKLAKAFKQKLQKKAFADSAQKRQNWLYSKTPYYDNQYLIYPILMAF